MCDDSFAHARHEPTEGWASHLVLTIPQGNARSRDPERACAVVLHSRAQMLSNERFWQHFEVELDFSQYVLDVSRESERAEILPRAMPSSDWSISRFHVLKGPNRVFLDLFHTILI